MNGISIRYPTTPPNTFTPHSKHPVYNVDYKFRHIDLTPEKKVASRRFPWKVNAPPLSRSNRIWASLQHTYYTYVLKYTLHKYTCTHVNEMKGQKMNLSRTSLTILYANIVHPLPRPAIIRSKPIPCSRIRETTTYSSVFFLLSALFFPPSFY